MSRIGKIPVSVPSEVKVSINARNVQMEGPKGKTNINLPEHINIEFKDQIIVVNRLSETKQTRSNHGTIRARLVSMVLGVTKGHKKDLEIQGVGFRAILQGTKIVFNLGFSNPVEYEVPADVKVTVPTQTSIILEGVSSERVGLVAAQIKSLKPVEPYKGKGIRYVGQFVRRKQGKSVTK